MTTEPKTALSTGIERVTRDTLRRFFALPLSKRRQILSDLGLHRGVDGNDFERDRTALLELKAEGRLQELARHV